MQYSGESTADLHMVSIIRLGLILLRSIVATNYSLTDAAAHKKRWWPRCWPMGNLKHITFFHPLSQPIMTLSLNEFHIALQICKASNQYGELKLEIALKVHSYLAVHISPQHQIVNSGAAGVFNCSVSGSADAQTEWFHNGKSIINDDVQGSSK